MEDVKQKLLELESQVSSIKDATLRKVAFEKLLDHTFATLSSKMSPTKVKVKTRRVKGKKSSTNLYYSESMIRDDIKKMNVGGTLKGLPNFKECKSKIDGYLWILAYGKTHKIDGLNLHEIAYILSKKLFRTTKYSTVFGIRRKVKDGLVIREPDTENWCITPDGETYLKNLNKEEK
ncbi:MAG: hypothetical protein HYU99_00160 [Deltaproteobacteria bacterium]|nr:hypothetical protein [Deltaproteobacteria bacterium]